MCPPLQNPYSPRSIPEPAGLSALIPAQCKNLVGPHFPYFFSLHYVNSKSIGLCFVTFLALRPLNTVLSLTHSISTFDPVAISEAITILALVFGRGLKSGILSIVAAETEAGKGCYTYSYKAADHE